MISANSAIACKHYNCFSSYAGTLSKKSWIFEEIKQVAQCIHRIDLTVLMHCT